MSKENLKGSKGTLTASKSRLSMIQSSPGSRSGSLRNIAKKEVPAPNPTNDQVSGPAIIYENTFKTKPDRK